MTGAELLPDAMEEAEDLSDALFRLRDHLGPHGVRDLVYHYSLHSHTNLQHDMVFGFTLPDELIALYYAVGGLDNDAVSDDMDDQATPTLAHLSDMKSRQKNGANVRVDFAIEAEKMGYTTLLICPIADAARLGSGGMTFYQEDRKKAPLMDSDFLMQVARKFHHSVKLNGQLGDYFCLTPKEKQTLYWSALGRTGEDMAKLAGVSTRSIELRLQSARQKLRANNTTEAVYRGVAHGILPLQDA